MAPNVAVHTISVRGKAGGIFVSLGTAVLALLLGLVSQDWAFLRHARVPPLREGLWEACTCTPLASHQQDWQYAAQALVCVALAVLLLALLLVSLYVCVHTVSKNSSILALLAVCCFAVLVHWAGLLVYMVGLLGGTGGDATLSWSFALSVLSSLLTLTAAIVTALQLRSAGVTL